MSLKVKTAKSLLENMNRHFGNKYKVNEEDLIEEPKKEDEVSEEEMEEPKKEEEPVMEEEGSEEEKEVEEDPKNEEGDLNDMGELEKGVAGIVEKLISEEFSVDNEKQCEAADCMKQLAESDDELSNKFMEALDDVTSAMKIEEDADGEAMVVFEPEKWAHLSEKYSKKK